MITAINWFSAELRSSEYFTARPVNGGHCLEGHAVLPIASRPALIRYRVDVDPQWRTRHVAVDIARGHEHRAFALETDGNGRWMVDGGRRPELTGGLDIDLGWTPSTNTLPIRRLRIAEGEERDIEVVWLQFPELALVRGAQTYRRLGSHRWQYRSDGFTATLDVDDDGYVRRYGRDLWVASASASG